MAKKLITHVPNSNCRRDCRASDMFTTAGGDLECANCGGRISKGHWVGEGEEDDL